MLGFPAHGGGDARAATGMIVENELLDRAGIQLAVFSQHHVRIRFAVRLLGRVQAIHVSFADTAPILSEQRQCAVERRCPVRGIGKPHIRRRLSAAELPARVDRAEPVYQLDSS